jgi:hypothetical protein
MRELFVYYRIHRDQAAAAKGQVRLLQAALRARHAGLQTRLLRRPETIDDLQTWMECYAAPAVPGGISGCVQADIEAAAAALTPWVEGVRHVELFEALDGPEPRLG